MTLLFPTLSISWRALWTNYRCAACNMFLWYKEKVCPNCGREQKWY